MTNTLPPGSNRKHIILVTFLTILWIHKGESTQAVTLKPKSHKPNPNVCYPDELPSELGANPNICAFVMPVILTKEEVPDENGFDGVIFTLSHQNSYLEASFVDSHLTIATNDGRFTYDKPFQDNVWRKICVAITDTGVRARVGDYEIELLQQENANETQELSEDFYESFCIGSTKTSARSFSGTLTALFVSDWGVYRDTFFSTDCSNVVPTENVFSLRSTWSSNERATIFNYDDFTLCSEAFTPITIQGLETRKRHMDTCNSFNGRLMTKGEVSHGFLQNITKRITTSCTTVNGNVFWVGGNITGTELLPQCPTANLDGTLGKQPCINELHCTVCVLPTNLTFTIYGNLPGMDRSYTLLNSADGKVYLKGRDASEIHHNGDYWVLSSHLHNKEWHLTKIFPTGRNNWNSGDENVTLTLTQCSKKQFACNGGHCITTRELCDGHSNCDDGSDEENCNIFRLPESYKTSVPPPIASDADVSALVDVYYAGDINASDLLVQLYIKLRLNWYDSRVQFRVLKEQKQNFPCKDLWTPTPLVVPHDGASGGEPVDLNVFRNECFIYGDLSEAEVDMEDHRMGVALNGTQQLIGKEIYVRPKFPCDFRLHRYPFGSYKCSLMFLSPDKDITRSIFAGPVNDPIVIYDKSQDLLDFRLQKITLETKYKGPLAAAGDGPTYIVLTLHLQGVAYYHLLTSFTPSGLMFLICLSSFFFPVSDFKLRMLVSLTSLLVLTILFNQSSASSITTSYHKVLDVWYMCLIFMCIGSVFMLIIINSLWHKNYLPMQMQWKPLAIICNSVPEESSLSYQRRAAFCNGFSIAVFLTLFIFLTLAYILIAADVV